MSKIGIVENGLRKHRVKRRRRNPMAVAKVKKNPAARRRTVSLTSAKAVAKRNGFKLSKIGSISNPKRKHHRRKRRNGVTAITRRSNGILGNTKQDAKQVGTIIGGAAATKALSRFVSSFIAPYLAQVGVGSYSEIIIDGAVALFVVPMLAGKLLRSSDSAKNARIGGLIVVGIDLINQVAPNALQYNPFNTNPVVLTAGGPAVSPGAVAQLAQGVATSANPVAAAAAVGRAMNQLDSAGSMGGGGFTYQDSMSDADLVI